MYSAKHHIPDAMLATYAAGHLPKPFAVVITSHVSMCTECRAKLEAHYAMGGVVLDETDRAEVSSTLKSDVMAKLNQPYTPAPVYDRNGIYPGPVVQALNSKSPKWKTMGMGVKQQILSQDDEGSLRLLHIPSGQAMPEHGHHGLELTLVLQGSFKDETGEYKVGDVEVGDQDLDHTPIAGEGAPCICLAATDAPLKFNAFIPRLLQPLFRI